MTDETTSARGRFARLSERLAPRHRGHDHRALRQDRRAAPTASQSTTATAPDLQRARRGNRAVGRRARRSARTRSGARGAALSTRQPVPRRTVRRLQGRQVLREPRRRARAESPLSTSRESRRALAVVRFRVRAARAQSRQHVARNGGAQHGGGASCRRESSDHHPHPRQQRGIIYVRLDRRAPGRRRPSPRAAPPDADLHRAGRSRCADCRCPRPRRPGSFRRCSPAAPCFRSRSERA